VLLEDAKKNAIIKEYQIIIPLLLLTINSEWPELCMKCDGMFDICILYIMYG
jgi:hypothetical protein